MELIEEKENLTLTWMGGELMWSLFVIICLYMIGMW